MKRAIITGMLCIILGQVFSQQPVNWSYTAKKINGNMYEVHLTATIADGWHIYAQAQPKDAIATPTKIAFTENPLLVLKGPVKEVGEMEKYKEEVLGIEQYQYARKVEFVQVVKLKVNTSIRTNVSGNLTFQTCTNEKCLPPETTHFTIALEG